LPGAPFLVSAAVYGVAIWAVAGVRPAPALVRLDTDPVVAATGPGAANR
jgi:hypothetical protein